jgi:lysophospholipase L1-like esterase
MSIATWIGGDSDGAPANPLTENKIVLFVGDSTTVGVGAGNGTGAFPEVTGARPLSFPMQAAAWLNAEGIPAVTDTFNSDNNNTRAIPGWTEYNPQIVRATSLVTSGTLGSVPGGPIFVSITTTTRVLGYNPPAPMDTLEMWTYQISTGGSYRVVVDGTDTFTFSNNNATERSFRQTLTVPLGVHTFEIDRNAGQSYFPYAMASYNSAVPSILVMNAGMRNFTSLNWTDTGSLIRMLNGIGTIQPDVTVINLGINDYRQPGTTIAQFKTNMQLIISKALENGGKALLVVPNPIQTYNTTDDAWSQAAVLTAYQELATANPGVPLINTPQLLFDSGLSGAANPATYGGLAGAGNMFDTLHPRAPVYAAMGAAVGQEVKTLLGL